MNTVVICVVVLVALLGVARAEPPASLPAEAVAAYETIRKADRFCSEAVGYAGETPDVVLAFRLLLKSPDADAAFKELLREGTLPGRLYALCGIYYTDPKEFPNLVVQYRDIQDKVPTFMGCIVSEQTIASIVEVDAENVIRLKNRKQTIKQWAAAVHPDSMQYDIVGGGWPNEFKESGGFRQEQPSKGQPRNDDENPPNKAVNGSRRSRGF